MAKFLAVLRLPVYVQYTCKKQKITRLGSISTLSSKWTRQQICKEIWKLAGPKIFIFIFSIFGHLTIWYTSVPCSPLLAATSAWTGPQMIPDRKWSPNWTATDPGPEMIPIKKIRNGMDGEMVWIVNWRTWIPMFLLQPSQIIIMAYKLLFSYFRLSFVANYDAFFSVKLWPDSMQHTPHILLC